MRGTWTDRGATLLLVCVMTSTSVMPSAFAQTPSAKEIEVARTAFKDGLQLEKDGKYEEALAKFEETAKVKTTAQVRFHIGLCNEKLGHWLAAIEAYEAAAKQAEAEGNAAEVLKVAPDLATKLRERMPKVTVLFPPGVVVDSLTIDGNVMTGAAAKEYPIEPGPHVVTAVSGEDKVREEFKVAEGETKTLSLKFGVAATPAPATYEDPAEKPREKPAVVVDDSAKGKATLGWVLTGVGVAAIGGSIAFYAVRSSKMSDLERVCLNNKCPSSTEGTISSAKTFTTLSGVALGVGIASLGAGIFFLVSSKKSQPEPEPTARIVPWAPGSQLGLGIEGAF